MWKYKVLFYQKSCGFTDTLHSIHIGIREGLYGPEDARQSDELGYKTLTAAQMYSMTAEEVIQCILDRVGKQKVFLTFDIDFLDPAYAPGTGTPVPGGFSTAYAMQIIRGLNELDIVGYDLVEVSPPYDSGEITAIAAAGIIQEFLSQIACHHRK